MLLVSFFIIADAMDIGHAKRHTFRRCNWRDVKKEKTPRERALKRERERARQFERARDKAAQAGFHFEVDTN